MREPSLPSSIMLVTTITTVMLSLTRCHNSSCHQITCLLSMIESTSASQQETNAGSGAASCSSAAAAASDAAKRGGAYKYARPATHATAARKSSLLSCATHVALVRNSENCSSRSLPQLLKDATALTTTCAASTTRRPSCNERVSNKACGQ